MIRINGQHLIRRILEGERYFAGMILEDNFNLIASPDFPELQKYLLKQKFWCEPIFFSGRKLTESWQAPSDLSVYGSACFALLALQDELCFF